MKKALLCISTARPVEGKRNRLDLTLFHMMEFSQINLTTVPTTAGEVSGTVMRGSTTAPITSLNQSLSSRFVFRKRIKRLVLILGELPPYGCMERQNLAYSAPSRREKCQGN